MTSCWLQRMNITSHPRPGHTDTGNAQARAALWMRVRKPKDSGCPWRTEAETEPGSCCSPWPALSQQESGQALVQTGLQIVTKAQKTEFCV